MSLVDSILDGAAAEGRYHSAKNRPDGQLANAGGRTICLLADTLPIDTFDTRSRITDSARIYGILVFIE